MYCNKCGKEIDDEALICPHCGCGTVNYIRDQAKAEARVQVQSAPSRKKRSTALLLCIFLGNLSCFFLCHSNYLLTQSMFLPHFLQVRTLTCLPFFSMKEWPTRVGCLQLGQTSIRLEI